MHKTERTFYKFRVGRPFKSEARETRRDILNAALDLFAKNGYSGTSIRDLAAAVGVRESALYHHFPGGKRAILDGVCTEFAAGQVGELHKALELAETGSVDRAIRGLAHRILDVWSSPRAQKFARVMFGEGPRLPSQALRPRVVIERLLGSLAGFFERLADRGLVRPFDPRLLAREFIGPMLQMRFTHLLATGSTDIRPLRRQVNQHVDFFLEAVRV